MIRRRVCRGEVELNGARVLAGFENHGGRTYLGPDEVADWASSLASRLTGSVLAIHASAR